MKETKVIYLIVALTLTSENEISEDIYQEVVRELDYNFTSKTETVKIDGTLIKELSEKMPVIF